ncbi:hypothetical protein [Aridibaculum aurantiacum]|uniref:hypothetical protein n=1 Tax=Aridibaculum aurantiacum TaxID=2810307 RepID=UPI001A968609|nr:hypothetical protein [Aridibaculum aurantiacum]
MSPKSFILILFIVIVFIWFMTVGKVTQKEIEDLRKREVKGSISRMFKKETDKNYTVIFSNGTDFDLPFSAPTDGIEPGDSMFKAANSLDYIFFKGGKVDDTIVYRGTLNGNYRP